MSSLLMSTWSILLDGWVKSIKNKGFDNLLLDHEELTPCDYCFSPSSKIRIGGFSDLVRT